MFTIKINNEEFEFDHKVKLLDLTNNDKNIICALVNGIVRDLNYEVYYNSTVKFLTLRDHDAMGIYEASLRYIFAMACYECYPKLQFKLTYSVSRSIYAQIVGKSKVLNVNMVQTIKDKMNEIIEKDYQFRRMIVPNDEAAKIYEERNLHDKKAILKYRPEKTVHFYECNGYLNYMYGKMVPSTGYIKKFDIRIYSPGLLLSYPRSEYCGEIPPFKDEPTFSSTLIDAQSFGNLVNLSSVPEINARISDPTAVELINICENRHNRMLCELGERIENSINNIRIICIAGPSSSGKTTFANRLVVELLSRGIKPIRISIDDYYKNREDVPKNEDGEYDFEALDALDVEQFNKDLLDLLNGKTITLPKFSFKNNRREKGRTVKIGEKEPIIIEGIHALNEKLTPLIPKYLKFKIYIAPQAQINIDNSNPISLTDIRLIRRIVRDFQFRDSSAEETISMWPNVRKGEFTWIYNTQEDANYVFDSFLNYELCVLKKYALPLLLKIDKEGEYGPDAERLIRLLKYFKDIDDRFVPCNSILQEFIGRSAYENF